jgi:hypothetical protein
MGMALPKRNYDEQFGTRTLQVEKALPPGYARTLELAQRKAAQSRWRLWGLGSRWMALPLFVRWVLLSCFLLMVLGGVCATANLQSEFAKTKFEEARFSYSGLQDMSDEINSIAPPAFSMDFEDDGK